MPNARDINAKKKDSPYSQASYDLMGDHKTQEKVEMGLEEAWGYGEKAKKSKGV